MTKDIDFDLDTPSYRTIEYICHNPKCGIDLSRSGFIYFLDDEIPYCYKCAMKIKKKERT
jgi:hypothetical protein